MVCCKTLQKNVHTGFVRPIERLVSDRPALPLPRCPKETMSLTSFREGTTYSIVTVTKVRDARARYKEMELLRSASYSMIAKQSFVYECVFSFLLLFVCVILLD